jgi:phosphomannomutase
LVAVADYILSKNKGNTVSNLSSSRALRDVTEKHGGTYFASAVGEVNVVKTMKAENAVIGGEGNGGIIYPKSHYGRDSLVGVALFLSHLAHKKIKASTLRKSYPSYYMSKNKIQLTPQLNVDELLVKIKEKYKNEDVNTIDGVKIDFPTEWVHLRKSNTEPIIRIYTESTTQANADALAERMITEIKEIAGI